MIAALAMRKITIKKLKDRSIKINMLQEQFNLHHNTNRRTKP